MVYIYIIVLFFSYLCNAMDRITLPNQNSEQGKWEWSVAFPTNDIVVKVNHDSWSTFCAKTGKPLLHIPRKSSFRDFSLSKNGKIAILGNKLHVYHLETGEVCCSKRIGDQCRNVAFLTDNETVIISDNFGRVIISDAGYQSIGTVNLISMRRPISVSDNSRPTTLRRHPSKDEFLITHYNRRSHAIVTLNRDALNRDDSVTTKKIIEKKDDTLFSLAIYNPNGTVMVINDQDKWCRFYSIEYDDHYLRIGLYKKVDRHSANEQYIGITFHPQKSFVALTNQKDNTIEFWDYTKKTEKPLATIPLKNIGEISCDFSRHIAFCPNGDKFVVISRYDNNCYIIPTPEAAYYDEYTKEQCIFINWAMKNNSIVTIPPELIRLMIKTLSKLSDLHLINKKLEQNRNSSSSFCAIS